MEDIFMCIYSQRFISNLKAQAELAAAYLTCHKSLESKVCCCLCKYQKELSAKGKKEGRDDSQQQPLPPYSNISNKSDLTQALPRVLQPFSSVYTPF